MQAPGNNSGTFPSFPLCRQALATTLDTGYLFLLKRWSYRGFVLVLCFTVGYGKDVILSSVPNLIPTSFRRAGKAGATPSARSLR